MTADDLNKLLVFLKVKGIFTLVRMFAYMVGTKYEHRGVKNLT